MLIQINAGDVESSAAIEQRVEDEVNKALKHIASHVTRVEVHLHDDTQGKLNQDLRVVMEGRLRGVPPIAVEQSADDLYEAIHQSAGKLARALKHKIERVHPSPNEVRRQ